MGEVEGGRWKEGVAGDEAGLICGRWVRAGLSLKIIVKNWIFLRI